jgi:hypothetical protein
MTVKRAEGGCYQIFLEDFPFSVLSLLLWPPVSCQEKFRHLTLFQHTRLDARLFGFKFIALPCLSFTRIAA